MTKVHKIRRQRLMKLIKQLMDKGYNQSKIAAMIGVPRQYMCDFMKGRREVGELFIFRLAYALGMDPGILLYGTTKEKP